MSSGSCIKVASKINFSILLEEYVHDVGHGFEIFIYDGESIPRTINTPREIASPDSACAPADVTRIFYLWAPYCCDRYRAN